MKPATALTAQRIGERVILHWTVPGDTTDGGSLRLPLTAVLCRAETPAVPQKVFCAEVARLATRPGPAEASDRLPPNLRTGEARLLIYRVELLNPQSRSAGPSAPAYAAAGATPNAVASLTIRPARNGVVLAWAADQTGAVEVTRTAVPPDRRAPKAAAKKNPFAGRSSEDESVTLAAGVATDPGGMIDRGVHDGDTVIYTANRVRRVELEVPASSAPEKNGRIKETKASRQEFELRGEPSAPVTLTYHDVMPPSAPVGVAAVPGGGFGQPASIDLSWEPSPEQDVVGYNIYRAGGSDAEPGRKLNAAATAASAYSDRTAIAGTGYLYRVTAIDRRGHESAGSTPVSARLNP